jgi:FHA domain
VPESVLTILKFCFLALLYLFLWRVVRVVLGELRAPADTDEEGGANEARRERKPRRGARLRILEPPAHEGEIYPLAEEITVGRGGGCSIVLPDDNYVSTVHARLFRRGSDVFVEDLGSRNGTYVNGTQVSAPTRLRRGDRVQFGQTVGEVVR